MRCRERLRTLSTLSLSPSEPDRESTPHDVKEWSK